MASDRNLVDSLLHVSACLGSLMASAASVVAGMAVFRIHRVMVHLSPEAHAALAGSISSLDTFRFLSLVAIVLAAPATRRRPRALGLLALAVALIATFVVWVAL